MGKTLVSCLLARALKIKGISAGVMKPYASGSWEDTKALKEASGVPESLKEITPVYYAKPLAPIVRRLTKSSPHTAGFPDVMAAFRRWIKKYPFLLVEGIGGALVPIEKNMNAADMARRFGFPVWVVARPGLGTLNHTLLTLEALRRRGLRVERIVISGYEGKNQAEKTNPLVLRKLTRLPVTLLPLIHNTAHRDRVVREWVKILP